MLVNCPRCGFQQPNDKYCAQCGVDMETFKPTKPSFFKSILRNPLIQLSALVLVSGVIAISVYKQNQSGQGLKTLISPKTASQSSKGLEKSFVPNTPEFKNDQAPEAHQAINTASTAADSLSADGTITAHRVSPTNANPTAVGAADTKTASKQPGATLVVYYAEVSRASLGTIFNNSKSTGQFMEFADYSAGIVPNIGKAISSPQIKILHKEVRPIENGKTIQWFYGIKDPHDHMSDIGIGTIVEINDLDSANLRGNLEIQRFWRDANATGGYEIQKKSFPAIVEIGGETGFFLSGVMPRRSYLEDDQEIQSIDVFKILQSSAFRSGDSSFVIFIEFDNSN